MGQRRNKDGIFIKQVALEIPMTDAILIRNEAAKKTKGSVNELLKQ